LAYENWTDIEFVISTKKVKVKKGDPGYYPDFSFLDKGDDVILTETYPEEKEIESKVVEEFEVLLPVMEYRWEKNSDEDSTTSVQLLSSEIIEHFSLASKNQSLDLFEKNGEQISQTFKSGSNYKDLENFIYIRKDMLDKFLTDKKLKMIWVVWGERRKENYDSPRAHKDFYDVYGTETIQTFYQIIPYEKLS